MSSNGKAKPRKSRDRHVVFKRHVVATASRDETLIRPRGNRLHKANEYNNSEYNKQRPANNQGPQ